MDEADRASEEEEYARGESLYLAQKNSRLLARGCCYNCDEPLEGRLFCDVDCRKDYERRQQRKLQ